MRERTKNHIENLVAYVIVVIALMMALMPIYWMVSTSFKYREDALAMPPKLIFTPTLDNYFGMAASTISSIGKSSAVAQVWEAFVRSYGNSIVISLSATALGLCLGVPAAYSLSRFRFKGRENIAFFILTSSMVPGIAVVIPLFQVFRQFNLIDTHLALIIVYTIMNLPLVTWMLRSFIHDIPKDLEEAGQVDGCTRLQAFSKIVLPLILPGLAATAILSFIWCWNEFLFAFVFSLDQAKTVTVTTYNWIGEYDIDWGRLTASGTLITLPILIFTLIVQKYIIKGLTFGAVRG